MNPTDRTHFATLRPRNEAAILAFSELWDAAKPGSKYGQRYTHHRKFMTVGADRVRLGDVLHAADPETSTALGQFTDTSTADPDDSLDKMVWEGSYLFDIDVRPTDPYLGWCCGAGMFKTEPEQGYIDIALCLPTSRTKLRVHGFHAHFNFNVDAVAFSIVANSPVILDDEPLNGNSDPRHRILNEYKKSIHIGKLSYDLTYTIEAHQQALHAERVESYMQTWMNVGPLPVRATPTPVGNDHALKGRRIIRKIVGGEGLDVYTLLSGEGIFSTASKLNPDMSPLATESAINTFEKVRDLLEGKEGSEFVIEYEDSVFSRGHGFYTMFQPTILCDFTRMADLDPQPSDSVRLQLFLQIMKGVAALHKAGFVHRDLKAVNLGVSSIDPPHAVIMDFVHAAHPGVECGLRTEAADFGTPGNFAPEVEKMHGTYGTPFDIWSMGCVAYQMLFPEEDLPWVDSNQHPINPWRTVPYEYPLPTSDNELIKEKKKAYNQFIQDEPRSGLETIVKRMLSVSQQDRPSAEQVVAELELWLDVV